MLNRAAWRCSAVAKTITSEWIRMLHVVKGQDPNEQAWSGITAIYSISSRILVGPVKYYYSWNSHILALTYGAALVGEAQQELAALSDRCS